MLNVGTEIIALSDVLKKMDEGETFSIRFVKCNRIKKTGGQLVTINHARKLGKHGPKPEPYQTAKNGKKVVSKNPDHYKNFTRNIKDMMTRKTIKIHCRLITRFNGIRVRY